MSMNFARLENDREVSASDLSDGIIRSNNYFCIYCGEQVSYVTSSSRARAFFRHKKEESCFNYSSNIEDQVDARIINIKSSFHSWWQSLFSQIEYRFDGGKHIADIYLQSNLPIQIYLDDKSVLFDKPKPNLVIEIQHSNITTFDAKNREEYYRNDDRELLWIFNISHIKHYVEHITTVTTDFIRIVFLGNQHTGLSNLLSIIKHNNILLDTGKYLYAIKSASLDEDYIYVSPMSKIMFINQINNMGFNLNIENISDTNYNNIPDITVIRNYKDIIELLDEKHQVDIDDIFTIIESISINEIRSTYHYFTNIYTSYISMIASLLSLLSNKDKLVLRIFKEWVDNVRTKHYKNDRFTFGKHKGNSIVDIPISYLEWATAKLDDLDDTLKTKMIEIIDMSSLRFLYLNTNIFNLYALNRLKYYVFYKKYLHYYVNSIRKPKYMIESINKRTWLDNLKKVIPNEDGYVYGKCIISNCYSNDDIIKKEGAMSNDEDAYITRYKPMQYNNEYIEICEDCLINNYWHLDDRYQYDYGYKLGIKLPKCAFRDVEQFKSNCPTCRVEIPAWVLDCNGGLCVNCAVKKYSLQKNVKNLKDI